ncbi:unnamed protein product, partial [Pocillopora meandrina]
CWEDICLSLQEEYFKLCDVQVFLNAVLVYEFRNRPWSPWSPWSLCGSVVEHRRAKSEGLAFDSSKGLRIFFLSHVRNETKNNFLYFFIELKTYHLSYHLSEFEGLKFKSSWRRKNIYTSNVLVFISG